MKYFTPTHEWCDLDSHRVGISAFAKQELGDIVYVQTPKLHQEVKMGEELYILESTKSAADVYAPYEGIITEINPQALEFINQDPEGKGWLVKITPTEEINMELLLDPEGYQTMVSG